MSQSASSVDYDAAEEFEGRQTPLMQFQHMLHTYPWVSPAIVLVLTMAFFSLYDLEAGNFASLPAMSTIINQAIIVALVGLGQTLIILTAGIDLSCGAIMVFSSMVMATLAAESGVPGLLALLIGVVLGGLAGLVNGWLVTRVKLPPFIVTLGTWNIFLSATLLYTKGRSITGDQVDSTLLALGDAFVIEAGREGPRGDFSVIYAAFLMLALYGLFAYILRNTAWGTHVYAVGDDPEAARLAGIRVTRVLLSVYIVAGVIYGIAAWAMIGRVGAAGPNNFAELNLEAITAVVIGGTSLFGGRGRVIGTLIGALIVTSVTLGLSLVGIDQAWKTGAIGFLVIVAVTADQWIRKARA